MFCMLVLNVLILVKGRDFKVISGLSGRLWDV